DSDNSEHERKDGMDAVICNYNFNANRLQFAAANNPLWLMRNGELLEYKPDKMPVGRAAVENKPFSLQELQLEKGDIIYTLTDGYADQFGGPKGKKFMYKAFEEILNTNKENRLSMVQQTLTERFDTWKGDNEQIDDVTVIGIEV
ncbi:MAG TPA: SpoIIE family protein phosphatase, partial [Bacteroidia bacterium]|nr:SpoIIE family protein phosphatase [Bacteroidia bacterium]